MSPAAAITGSAAASAVRGPITASMVTAVVASRRAARVIGPPSVRARSETSDTLVSMTGRFEPRSARGASQAADLGLLYPLRVDTAGAADADPVSAFTTHPQRDSRSAPLIRELTHHLAT